MHGRYAPIPVEPADTYVSTTPGVHSKKDYRYLNRLGEGGFGRVFLATEKKSGKKVAIKEMCKQTLINGNKAHYAMRERMAMRRMDHPLIIKLLASFQDSKKLYFVMEYCLGGDLYEQFIKYRKFTNEVTRFYSAEIVLALEYLRHRRIIHRDLKAENIFLDKNKHIKLADFGLAVILEDHEVGSRRSIARARKRHVSFAGTPLYVSPEVVKGERVVLSTDLWSLGVMLYEFHTGRSCFIPDDTIGDQIKAGHHSPWPAGSLPELMNLADGLMNIDPAQRIGAADMNEIKNHTFYGTEDPDDWEHLYQLIPPPFDPNAQPRQRRNATSTAPDAGGANYGTFGPADASRLAPAVPTPPEFLDYDYLDPSDDESCCPSLGCTIL